MVDLVTGPFTSVALTVAVIKTGCNGDNYLM